MRAIANCIIVSIVSGVMAPAALAQGVAQPVADEVDVTTPTGQQFHFVISGGAEYQFETSLDTGDMSVARSGGGVGVQTKFSDDLRAAVNINYGVDLYRFDGHALGIVFPGEAWDTIHTITATAIFSLDLSNDWTVFGGPQIQTARETGADWGDSISGGGAIGLTYQWSRDLTIGGGVSVVTQLEDDPRILPIIVIDWAITNDFRLRNQTTNSSISRTGLELVYEAGRGLEFAIGGAFQFSRFRLDDVAPVPGGVGEDEGAPVWFRATFKPTQRISIDGVAGFNFDGELHLISSNGTTIAESDYDPAFFAGVFASIEF